MRIGRRRSQELLELSEAFDSVVERAKDGDEVAATVVYENHVAMVYGYFRACGVVDVDDLTSDVFVGVLRNLRGFTGDQPDFRRWLMTIAHHRLVDERRRRSIDRTEPTTPAELEVMTTAPNVVELRALAIDPHLIAALDSLTLAQREVLALRFVADLSLAGVAHVTSRPVGAVKSLQNRGLAGLRRYLSEVHLRHGTGG